MSRSGGYHEYIGGYHEYIGGISWVHCGIFSTLGDIMMHVGEQVDKNLWIYIENPSVLNFPHVLMISPTCIMLSPNVLNIPHVLMISPHASCYPPVYWTSPMYSWYPHNVLMVSPLSTEHPLINLWYSSRCTHGHGIPPMYWTPTDVLNTHDTGWFIENWKLKIVVFDTPVSRHHWYKYFSLSIRYVCLSESVFLRNVDFMWKFLSAN